LATLSDAAPRARPWFASTGTHNVALVLKIPALLRWMRKEDRDTVLSVAAINIT